MQSTPSQVWPCTLQLVMARPSGYTHFTDSEHSLLSRWQAEGKTPTEVAKLLDHDLSVVARHYKRNDDTILAAVRRVGRPPALTERQAARAVEVAQTMIEAADGHYQVTVGMVRRALKLKCCDRTVLDALHKEGVWFHSMREKPILTPDDVKDRHKFACAHCRKPASFWEQCVHAYLDNKNFPLYLTGKARAYAAKRTPPKP